MTDYVPRRMSIDRELRFLIGVHEVIGVDGRPSAVITQCGACGQRVEHYLPFKDAQEYADQHATRWSMVACRTLYV